MHGRFSGPFGIASALSFDAPSSAAPSTTVIFSKSPRYTPDQVIIPDGKWDPGKLWGESNDGLLDSPQKLPFIKQALLIAAKWRSAV
jgi:hypothetical protein